LTRIPLRDTLYPNMAYKATTIEELLAIMKRVQGEKTLTQFAADLDISKQYLSNVYNRHKEPSERLLEKLGFSRQTTYVRSPAVSRQEQEKKK
jgi:transcriptional regulator with XRE-family HTH domain